MHDYPWSTEPRLAVCRGGLLRSHSREVGRLSTQGCAPRSPHDRGAFASSRALPYPGVPRMPPQTVRAAFRIRLSDHLPPAACKGARHISRAESRTRGHAVEARRGAHGRRPAAYVPAPSPAGEAAPHDPGPATAGWSGPHTTRCTRRHLDPPRGPDARFPHLRVRRAGGKPGLNIATLLGGFGGALNGRKGLVRNMSDSPVALN